MFAQAFSFKIYGVADGLPDAFINSIYQDQKGYLWIGTKTSLCRFNGNEFVNFGYAFGNSTGTGMVCLQDRKQRYWIHTKKGMALLERNQLRYFPLSDGLSIGWLFSVTELSNGAIWMLTDKGIYEYQDTVWRKKNFVTAYADQPCRYAVETTQGIYLNYASQLFLLDKSGNASPITAKQNSLQPYYVWLKKYNNQVYVSTIEGLYRIDGIQLIPLFEKQLKGISSYDFLIDTKNRTWVCTEKYGLLISEPGNRELLTHHVPLPFNLTLLLTEDREGNVWAHNYEGLLQVKDAYFEVFDKKDNVLLQDIRHLTVKPDGNLFI